MESMEAQRTARMGVLRVMFAGRDVRVGEGTAGSGGLGDDFQMINRSLLDSEGSRICGNAVYIRSVF